MKEYLTQEKQKELKSFLKKLLTEKQRQAYKNIVGRMRNEFYDTIEYNVRDFYHIINEDIQGSYPEIYKQMENFSKKGQLQEVNRVAREFIDKHYPNEWDFVNNFNFFMARAQLQSFCVCNIIPNITLEEVMNCENLEIIIGKYDKKNVDPELIKRTQIIKKNIDDWYNGVPKNIFDAAVGAYLSSGRHEYILHNNLVRDL